MSSVSELPQQVMQISNIMPVRAQDMHTFNLIRNTGMGLIFLLVFWLIMGESIRDSYEIWRYNCKRKK